MYFADVRQFMSSSRSNPFRDSIESDIKSCSGSNEHKIERWRLVSLGKVGHIMNQDENVPMGI